MSYTEEQCQDHYRILVETIEYLLKQRRITEDWMEKHKKLIMTYDAYFSGSFLNINSEINDPNFRNLAVKATTILSELIDSIITRKTFNVRQYLIFNQTIKQMVDTVNDHHDNFIEAFANMGI